MSLYLPSRRPLALSTGVGAAAYASMPAPAGWRWVFVTFLGERQTFNGVPQITLEAV